MANVALRSTVGSTNAVSQKFAPSNSLRKTSSTRQYKCPIAENPTPPGTATPRLLVHASSLFCLQQGASVRALCAILHASTRLRLLYGCCARGARGTWSHLLSAYCWQRVPTRAEHSHASRRRRCDAARSKQAKSLRAVRFEADISARHARCVGKRAACSGGRAV